MKTILDKPVYEEIINRLENVKADSPVLWGKMNAPQIMEHLQKPMEIAMGRATLKQSFLGIVFGKLVKKKLLDEKEFGKNSPTAPEFIIRNTPDFQTEKSKLLALIKEFHEGGESIITPHPHPFFGKMTSEEWQTLQYKHLDHHLRQLGV